MSDFESMIKSIKQYNPTAAMEVVHNEKLSQDFLYVYVRGASRKIMVFEEGNEIKPVATVLYSIGSSTVNISSLEVDEKFQRNGIGTSLMQTILAHGDCLGATRLKGSATPINTIKDVSSFAEDNRQQEQQAINSFYSANGCHFIEGQTYTTDGEKFEQMWKSGEKIKSLPEDLILLTSAIVETEPSKIQNHPKTVGKNI